MIPTGEPARHCLYQAAEMADTLKDSGSHVRPPKTGEYGWQGGVVTRGKTGFDRRVQRRAF